MRSIRRSGVTALTAAIALSLGAVPVALTVPAIVAGGEGTTTLTPASVSVDKVELSTTSAEGTVTYNGLVQKFNGGQQCEITPSSASGSSADLLKITGTIGGDELTGQAGFRDGDIGVYEATAAASSPNSASQCFRVDAGSQTTTESLTLELDPNGDFSDLPFSSDSRQADRATVDLRAKTQSGTVKVEFLDSDSQVVITTSGAPYSETYTWGTKVKSGAPITIPLLNLPESALFSGVRLTATVGSFSLRGATFTLLSQAEYTFCNPGNPTPGSRSTATELNTTITYLGNVDGSNTCFGATLNSGPLEVQFLKPRTVAPDAQFLLDVDWTLPNPDGTPGVVIPDTVIDFEIGALNINDLPFCSEFTGSILTRDSSSGRLKISDYGAFSSSPLFVDFEPASTDREWGCVDTRSSEVTSDNIIVHDLIFVIGDLRMRIS